MKQLSVWLVFDRKHVATKKHQSSVQLEITYERKRKFIGTGIKLYVDQWSKDLKVKNHPQSALYNQQLSDIVADIYDFAHQLSLQKKEFSWFYRFCPWIAHTKTVSQISSCNGTLFKIIV